jgi:prevent-host-death family protein
MGVSFNFWPRIMQTLSSAKVQANFGQAMDIAKSGEPVTITQYGRPTLMLFSHKEGEELLRLRSTIRLNRYLEGRAKTMPKDAPELTMDDIDKLVHELRP